VKYYLISYCKYLAVLLVAFFTPILQEFWFVAILVIVDTITGVMKAGKEDINNIFSTRMWRFIPKLIFYFLLVIVAYSCEKYVEPNVPFTKLSLIGMSFIEIKSIDENFKELFGFSFLNKVFEGVKSINNIKRKGDEI
jgi:phage-related holin